MEDWEIEMKELEELRDIAQQLSEYADLEGSELGEVCAGLIQLTYYTSYLDNEFVKALRKEVEDNLTSFKEGSKIVTEEVTRTATETTLEWN